MIILARDAHEPPLVAAQLCPNFHARELHSGDNVDLIVPNYGRAYSFTRQALQHHSR